LDSIADTTCSNRLSYKLKSIDHNGRSSKDIEEWNKVIHHAETQARVRAVQVHLNCITTLSALPLTYSCCEIQRPLPAASAAAGFHTDEYEREWIYDSGAASCMVGWDHLTNEEKSRTFQVPEQGFITAGWPV
jgi:hypothetical protein